MLWEIKPLEKKNVYQRTYFTVGDDSPVAPGKTFYIDEMYRWGRCVVRTDEQPVASDEPYKYPFDLSNYEIEDQECDDGCSLEFGYEEDVDGWTEDEKEWLEALWDEGYWSAFDENEIYSDDCETVYYGPLEIVCIDSTPEREPAPIDPSKPQWPFTSPE